MSIHIDPSGRRRVDPGDLDRGQVRRLRAAARRRTTTPPPPSEAERCEAIVAATGQSVETVTLVRWRARHGPSPATVDDYMAGYPYPFERADCPDPEVRL